MILGFSLVVCDLQVMNYGFQLFSASTSLYAMPGRKSRSTFTNKIKWRVRKGPSHTYDGEDQ